MTIDEAYKLLNIHPNKSYPDSMIEAGRIFFDAKFGMDLYGHDPNRNEEQYLVAQHRYLAAKLVYEDALKQMIRRELQRHDDNKADLACLSNRVG